MKKLFTSIYLISMAVFFTACGDFLIENKLDDYGSVSITGKWPKQIIENNSNSAKRLNMNTSTIELKLESQDGSQTIEKTISRTGNDQYFTVEIEGMEVGLWKSTLIAKDSSGNKLSQSITYAEVTTETTAFNAVFGPANYLELVYLEDYLADYYCGDFVWIEMYANLEIKKITYETSYLTVYSYEFTYNSNGLITYWDYGGSYESNSDITYAYNSGNRLSGYSYELEGEEYLYEYYKYNANNQVISEGDYITYEYDSDGRIKKKSYDYTNGSSYIVEFTWKNGLLISKKKTYTGTSSDTELYEYEYDSNNRLISKSTTYNDGTPYSTTYEYDSNGVIISGSSSVLKRDSEGRVTEYGYESGEDYYKYIIEYN